MMRQTENVMGRVKEKLRNKRMRQVQRDRDKDRYVLKGKRLFKRKGERYTVIEVKRIRKFEKVLKRDN